MNVDIDRDVRPRLAPGKDRWLNMFVASLARIENDPRDTVVGRAGFYTHYHRESNGQTKERTLVSVTTLMKTTLMTYCRRPRNATLKTSKKLAKQSRPRAKRARGPSLRGAQLGSLVHQQMEDLVDMDAEGFRRKYPSGMHVSTQQLMRSLEKQGLLPLRPELQVFNLAYGRATRIDMVAIEIETGRLVFIEYKTGYGNGRFMQPASRLRWRHHKLHHLLPECSPYHMATVQLVLGVQMAVQMMQLPPEAIALRVMHVELDPVSQTVTQVHTIDYPPNAYALLDAVLTHVLTVPG